MKQHKTESVLGNFRFLSVSLLGSLAAGLAYAMTGNREQVAMLGAYVSMLAGLVTAHLQYHRQRDAIREKALNQLAIPLELARDEALFDHYCGLSQSLVALSQQRPGPLRQFALLKLTSMQEQVASLADGEIAFFSTETWRTVYADLLRVRGLSRYRSIAWVRTADYWQDAPGRRSMALNFAMVEAGLPIERIVILADDLWPPHRSAPLKSIRPWLTEQQRNGIALHVVRESDLALEPELLADVGIYGDEAVGVQELDEHAKTVRFLVHFDKANVRLAESRWERVSLYSIPYEADLDQVGCPI